MRTGMPLIERAPTKFIGKPTPRVDAFERVSGTAVYTGDVILPEMLHAAILRCPHAHAMVKKIDVSKAVECQGVHAVLSTADPEAKIKVPYPWWVPDGPPMLLFDPHCRYAGEEVAVVAAESQDQAWEALRTIQVDYEQLPFVAKAEDAIKPGGSAVHDSGNLVRPVDVYERGNLAGSFAEADVIVEQTYSTSCEIHTPLEPHITVAHWNNRRLTVWTSTQAIFNEQKQIATALNLPLSSVRVISHYVGGSFGSKAELSKHTLLAAILSQKTSRPVRLALTREETFLCVGNRPANTITIKAGAKKDGTLTALQFTNLGSVGAYADWAEAGGGVGLYLCPNVRIQETEAYTNAGKSHAFRGPGEVQCFWALEQVMDELADRIGMDPVGFRKQEAITLPNLRIAFLVLEGFHLEIVEDKRAFTREGLEKRIPEMKHLDNPVAGISKLAFYVTDLDAFAAKLKSEGVRFQTGIMEAKGNWPRSFIVLDNNGNWIQLVQSSTGSDRQVGENAR